MGNGDVKTVTGLKIEAVPAYNIVHERSRGKPFHPKGEGNGYVITFGDKRVYVAGDTENMPEMKAAQGHRRRVLADEPALHDDAGDGRRCGQGISAEDSVPLSLRPDGPQHARQSIEGFKGYRGPYSQHEMIEACATW